MPENEFFTFTQGRAVDIDGNIHIEGIGVVPDILLPVNEVNLLSEGDEILAAAVRELESKIFGEGFEGESIAIGDSIEGTLESGASDRYTLDLEAGDILNIFLESDEFEPVFALYDLEGTFLGSTEGLPEASIVGFEVLFDFSVIIEVLGSSGADSGNYILMVVEDGS